MADGLCMHVRKARKMPTGSHLEKTIQQRVDPMERKAMRRITASAFLFAYSLMGMAADTSPPQSISVTEYTHAHQLIDVENGRRLNVFCMGSGAPTVVFEAGGGDDSSSFRWVQARIARMTRVCSYDRAGVGFSDASSRSSTAQNIVSDLHRLIGKVAGGQPIVLIGHSDGGLYAPLYAATYPKDVAGMVLIDPFSVGDDQAATSVLTTKQKEDWYASDQNDIKQARQCLALAKKGLLTKPEYKNSPCLDNPPNADKAFHQVLNEELARPQEQEALLSATLDTYPPADHGLSPAEMALQHANLNFGSKPLIVLSAGKDDQGDLPVDKRKAIMKAWTKIHDELAARSTQGVNVVVPDSHHYIQKEQPDVVVEAVRQVVENVRSKKPLNTDRLIQK